jgi:adenylate cyclase
VTTEYPGAQVPSSATGQPETTRSPIQGAHPALSARLRFFEKVKRRNLVRVAILYLIACWVILEPTHVVFHMLEVPQWANRLVIVLMAIGFPLVMLFSWVYAIAPEGLQPTNELNPPRATVRDTARRLDRAIIVVLLLALGYLITDKFWLSGRIHYSVPILIATGVLTLAVVASAFMYGRSKKEPINVVQAAAPPQEVASDSGGKSIAVLPFIDMSEKKDQEYFSDGLSEELIDHLARTADLRVISRTSSFYFKGKQTTISEIAKTLNVTHVLEGSVRKSGGALRITVQLIRTTDATHVWSQTYERDLSDIFRVQDEIARTVAEALKVALIAGRASRERNKSNTEAYNLVLRGDYLTNRARSKDDIGTAIGYYNEAVALDPDYALAWAKLAAAYDKQAYIEAAPVGKNLPVMKAREAVQRALKIDPDLACAHRTLGALLFKLDWNWAAAHAEFERAKELDPSDVHVLTKFARMATIFGRFDEAIELYRQVIAQDPLEIMTQYELSYALLVAGRLQESADSWRTMVEPAPGSEYLYAVTLSYLGRNAEALQQAQKETHEGLRLQALSIVNWTSGRRADSDMALKELTDRFSSALPTNIAMAHACRGEIDAAFDFLERGYRQHDWAMTVIKVTPMLRNLHPDPRYKDLLVRMKLDGSGPGFHH